MLYFYLDLFWLEKIASSIAKGSLIFWQKRVNLLAKKSELYVLS
jgi:hypothetical protein